MNSIKIKLYELCRQHIEQRINTAKDGIQAAQDSSKEETKSSAGDKYETGRAMMQQEIENNLRQLSEAQKIKNQLDQIHPEKTTEHIYPGSLVITDQGNFYISIAAGQFTIEGKVYYAISPASPIGARLMGHKQGDELFFNGRKFIIEKIY